MQLVQVEHEVVVGVVVEIDDLEVQHCQAQHAFEVVHNVEASLLSNEVNAKTSYPTSASLAPEVEASKSEMMMQQSEARCKSNTSPNLNVVQL